MRILLFCAALALFVAPAGFARSTSTSLVLNEAPTLGSYVDFSVVVDKGSAASVAVICYGQSGEDQFNGTPRFAASPGVVTVSPQVQMLAAPGSACTAYLYRWVLKPNGSWQQTVAATLEFASQ